MRLGTFPYNARQELRWLDSQPSNVGSVIYTPKFDFMTSRMFVDIVWDLTGGSLTSFQAILAALGFSATAPVNQTTANGRLQARRILQNSNFRSQFTDLIVVNFNLFGNVPAKNQVYATDLLLRDMIYCGVNPLIEWNNGVVGKLRIGFWIHFERPFMNESATIFSVKNQNTVRINLPSLSVNGGRVNLYYASSIVEQKYLFYESGVTQQLVAPIANFQIDEANIQDVYLYDNAAISEGAMIQTFLNGILVGEAYPDVVKYNSVLDADGYPLSAQEYATAPNVIAPSHVDFGFFKIFSHPILNLPTVSNRNRNFRAQFGLTSNQNIRYFYTKILETDAARMESQGFVDRMISAFA